MKANEQFWIQDRYGVFAAIVGARHCQDLGALATKRGFTTPSLIFSQLLGCLSGGSFSAEAVAGQKWEHDFRRFRYE